MANMLYKKAIQSWPTVKDIMGLEDEDLYYAVLTDFKWMQVIYI